MESSEFLISVVVPCYNSSRTILRALDSVKSQTLQANEIIIVDDHSTDGSPLLISDFIKQNPCLQILFIQNESNQGPSFSRNLGIKKSQNEWIAFLDADDFWHPQKLEIQSALLKVTGSKIIGSVANTNHRSFESIDPKNVSTKIIRPTNMLWKNYFQTPTVLTAKCPDLFFDESMKYAEDFDLWAKLIKKYQWGIHTSPPLTFLGNEQGLRRQLLKMEMGEIYVLMKENNLFLRTFSILFSLLKFFRRLVLRWLEILLRCQGSK